MIERAAISVYNNHRGVDGCAATIARAPAHIRARINRTRAARGLPTVLGLAESRDLEIEVDELRRAAARQALQRGPGVWIDPKSKIAPRNGRPPAGGLYNAEAVRTITRVILIGDGGIATAKRDHEVVGEYVRAGAYGTAAELNERRLWTLVDGSHDGPAIEWAGPRLRALPTDRVPLLVEWLPDMKDPAHRAAVERIAAGENHVSLRSAIREATVGRIPQPTRIIKRATLLHVALLGGDRRAAYPGALAIVFRDKPAGAAELARQVEIAVAASRRRS
jgi:hypothetical protein